MNLIFQRVPIFPKPIIMLLAIPQPLALTLAAVNLAFRRRYPPAVIAKRFAIAFAQVLI
jgi:hypothetical protein